MTRECIKIAAQLLYVDLHVRHGLANRRVRGPISAVTASSCTSPRESIGATTNVAPVCSQTICHGTILAWCSKCVMSISSPGSSTGLE